MLAFNQRNYWQTGNVSLEYILDLFNFQAIKGGLGKQSGIDKDQAVFDAQFDCSGTEPSLGHCNIFSSLWGCDLEEGLSLVCFNNTRDGEMDFKTRYIWLLLKPHCKYISMS